MNMNKIIGSILLYSVCVCVGIRLLQLLYADSMFFALRFFFYYFFFALFQLDCVFLIWNANNRAANSHKLCSYVVE